MFSIAGATGDPENAGKVRKLSKGASYMALTNAYLIDLMKRVEARNPNDKQFLITVKSVLESIEPVVERHPEYVKAGVMELFVEQERVIKFRVPWIDDAGNVRVNRNSLTGLPIGGGKGGSDFDPKGKSDFEVMRFCQSFMTELYKYIGADVDVPAGDIGVGAREIGYLYGQYKRITGLYEGVLTGKGLSYGGSLVRTQATGYGLCYFTEEMLNAAGKSFKGQTVVISGSGNVAIYACEKATQLGAKVVAMCDSNGYIYDKNGVDLACVKQIKEVRRGRIKEYVSAHPEAEYHEGCSGIWTIPCDIALPCATQNEISLDSCKALVANGCYCVSEGANMPTVIEGIEYLQSKGVLFGPAKAANAGGVATSALEMSQNSERLSWTAEEVDAKLKTIMVNIYHNVENAAREYGMEGNFEAGANIAGFLKVAPGCAWRHSLPRQAAPGGIRCRARLRLEAFAAAQAAPGGIRCRA